MRGNGQVIHSTGIRDLEIKHRDGHPVIVDNVFSFICNDLLATRSMMVDEGLLLDKRGKLLWRTPFKGGPIWLCNGDTLKLTVTLSFHDTKEYTDFETAYEQWAQFARRHNFDPRRPPASSRRYPGEGHSVPGLIQ